MEKLDFATLKATVPIDSVLAHYGVQTRKRKGNQLVADCPFPSHANSEHKKDTLSINTESNIFYCHSDSCRAASGRPKGGDCIDVVVLIEGITPIEAAAKLSELFRPKPVAQTKKELTGNKPLGFKLEGLEYHPEIERRGITKETAASFGVGFFPRKGSMANRIVFPLYEHGVIVAYAGRTVLNVSDENPKWKFPIGFQKTLLYGLDRCDIKKPLLLVESSWGVLYYYQRNIQCVALLGKELTEEQEKLLEPFETIHLALDNDPKGKEATLKIENRLKEKHKVRRALLQE